MKKLKLLTLFFLFSFSICINTSDAQNYKMAAGLRLGYPTSATLKYFITESSALEGYVGTRGWSGYRWFNVSGAYQIHRGIDEVPGLQYYFGAGASVFFWNYDNVFLENNSSTSIGLQGYVGLDYVFEDVPINVSVDWVPTIFLNGYGSGFGAGYGTLAVRYVLN